MRHYEMSLTRKNRRGTKYDSPWKLHALRLVSIIRLLCSCKGLSSWLSCGIVHVYFSANLNYDDDVNAGCVRISSGLALPILPRMLSFTR